MGKKIFKPPSMESFISAEHEGHAFFSSKLFYNQGLLVGKDCEDLYRSLLQFDISSLPLFLTIVKSTLSLYLDMDACPAAEKSVEAFQILSNWNQEKVCWEWQPQTACKPVAVTTIATPAGSLVTFDLTALAEEWYTGQAANFGVLLKMSDELADNLVAFASGRFRNSAIWPYLELDFASCCSGGGHTPLDITVNVTTADNINFTAALNTLLFNYTYLIINTGANPASIHLEVSPNSAAWQTQSELATITPGQLITLVPDTVAKFSRLGYQSAHPGKPTTLSVYVQGLS